MFCLSNIIMTQPEFWLLIKAAKGSRHVGFLKSTISTDSEWDFGAMEACKIQILELRFWGLQENSNWIDYPNRFTNILSGIANCPNFKNSLKNIWLHDCGMDYKTGQSLLNQYNRHIYFKYLEILYGIKVSEDY